MTSREQSREEFRRLFEQALRAQPGDSDLERLGRESMLMSIQGDPELVSEWHRIAGAEQAVLDLHLGGAGVRDNSTSAERLAKFVSHIGSTVQRAAKEAVGRQRYPRKLLIEGVRPGSVRVVLRAPQPEVPPDQVVDDETLASTVDSNALRLVATIMAYADDLQQDSIITGAIQSLPPTARVPLRKAMEDIQRAGWEIRGSISQRGFGYNNLSLTTQGAVRLRQELAAKAERSYTEEIYGTITGSKDIEGIFWFNPEGGKEFRAMVEDVKLQRDVVRYQLDHPRVFARFQVFESHTPGAEEVLVRKSRTLQHLSLTPRSEQQNMF